MKYKIQYYLPFLFLITSCFIEFKKHGISPGVILKGEQEKQIQAVFNNRNYYDITNDFLVKIDTLQIESDDSLLNKATVDTNNNILQLYFFYNGDTVKTQLEISGSLSGMNEFLQFDKYKNFIFIVWVSEPFKPYRFTDNNPKYCNELHLKVIDVNNGQEIFNSILYKTNCCIKRLVMMFNPFNQSLLVAYNDFSKSDDRYLMFGWISLNIILKNNIVFYPMESLLQDRSEKRYPRFIKNENDIFLYNTSGDRYGMMAYTGKKCLGISKIDKENKLTDYRIISDSLPVGDIILLMGDTVFYSVSDSKNQYKTIYKKINLNNLVPY